MHSLRRVFEGARSVEKKYGNRVQVLSIVNPPDNQKTVQPYKTQKQISTPILFDCGQVTASYLQITPQNPTIRVPHFFVIDGKARSARITATARRPARCSKEQGIFKILEKYVPGRRSPMAREGACPTSGIRLSHERQASKRIPL